jgi:hypothetical protein
MLQCIALLLSQGPPPLKVSYVVERTVFLDALQNDAERSASSASVSGSNDDAGRQMETSTARREVLLRILARREASRLGLECGSLEVEKAVDSIRRQLGAATSRDLQRELEVAGLSEQFLWEYAHDLCVLEKLERFFDREIQHGIEDQLRCRKACDRMQTDLGERGDAEPVAPGDTASSNVLNRDG